MLLMADNLLRLMILLPFTAVLFLAATPAAAQDFYEGRKALERGDYEEALQEWRPLAEQGHPEAQYRLGLMYAHGRGLTVDEGEALTWFKKSAEQGHAEAQVLLGFMYEHGTAVARNYVMAHKWYSLAARLGPEHFKTYSESLAERMTSDQIAEALKLAREFMERHGQ